MGGRLLARKWACGVVMTNGYNNAGELITVSYDGDPPAITNGYDYRGRLTMIN